MSIEGVEIRGIGLAVLDGFASQTESSGGGSAKIVLPLGVILLNLPDFSPAMTKLSREVP